MGYACPVCSTPQSDARHLANHLAFTALIRGEDHEAWLDEHVPGWSERGEAELAERVVEFAEEEEFPQVFEDTVSDRARGSRARRGGAADGGEHGHDHTHGHGHEHSHGHGAPYAGAANPAPMDAEARAVVEEARELTERMRRDGDGEDDGSGGSAGDGNETDESDRDEPDENS
ncbi:DUF5810 domain-containing protein [Halomarina halobia]|uniref:DUF5810 domain-containing protein n=1 Tax=Halomarina halobia TaxID=3033386 RepID=A0ABD6AA43_9EURY|nr:DUF5810 domain-containing protein [Halomarina sp. PSR21]